MIVRLPFVPSTPSYRCDSGSASSARSHSPRGAAEVVLYTSNHEGSLATLGVDGVRAVVDLWAERTEALLARDDVAYVLVFENRGAAVGATIERYVSAGHAGEAAQLVVHRPYRLREHLHRSVA